ncbi:unnamed protein product [Polarella glacialis]|uniref:Uncharacterized protein n=1 Tax=Polarella glacialis TaxID=89957 RepID=A0A813DKW1_POLGL|nr:unnamed protein product [Polarella glacialis]
MPSARRAFVDCHCHLSSDQFRYDLEEVVARASHNGVVGIFVCSSSQPDIERVLKLRQEFPELIFPCLGLHPLGLGGTFDADFWAVTRSLIVAEHARRGIAGIGEIGLDFSKQILRDHAKTKGTSEADIRSTQIAAFQAQVSLAKELGVPVNVHSRNAERETLEILFQSGVCGLMHAFKGEPGLALEAARTGRLLFSFPPSLVYKREYQEVVRVLPMEALLLETDSPSLAAGGPKERNEPGLIGLAAAKMAEIKGLTTQEVAEITTRNAVKLFGASSPALLFAAQASQSQATDMIPKTARWRKPQTGWKGNADRAVAAEVGRGAQGVGGLAQPSLSPPQLASLEEAPLPWRHFDFADQLQMELGDATQVLSEASQGKERNADFHIQELLGQGHVSAEAISVCDGGPSLLVAPRGEPTARRWSRRTAGTALGTGGADQWDPTLCSAAFGAARCD